MRGALQLARRAVALGGGGGRNVDGSQQAGAAQAARWAAEPADAFPKCTR